MFKKKRSTNTRFCVKGCWEAILCNVFSIDLHHPGAVLTMAFDLPARVRRMRTTLLVTSIRPHCFCWLFVLNEGGTSRLSLMDTTSLPLALRDVLFCTSQSIRRKDCDGTLGFEAPQIKPSRLTKPKNSRQLSFLTHCSVVVCNCGTERNKNVGDSSVCAAVMVRFQADTSEGGVRREVWVFVNKRLEMCWLHQRPFEPCCVTPEVVVHDSGCRRRYRLFPDSFFLLGFPLHAPPPVPPTSSV